MGILNKLKESKHLIWIKKIYWGVRLFLTSLFFNISKFFRKIGIIDNYKDLKQLKNSYEGQRCFIIATGPSLTNEDILKLKNEYTFSMNAMCLKYEELGWTPTFFGIQDEQVFHRLKDKIYNSSIKHIFVDRKYRKQCRKESNLVYFPRCSSYNSYNAYFKNLFKVKFSDDSHLVVYDGFSITYSLIQIAVYMGFKKIYLLGCDCGYSKDPAKRYFVDHGVVGSHVNDYSERFFAAYRAADEFVKNSDVEIINSTRGGMLEIFPRVDLDSVLANGNEK